jgi:hypothetical protein
MPKMMRNRMILNITTAIDQASEVSAALALRMSKSSVTHKPLPEDIFSPDCCVGPGSRSQYPNSQQKPPSQDLSWDREDPQPDPEVATTRTWLRATPSIVDLIEEDNKNSDVRPFELLVPPALEENDLPTLERIPVHRMSKTKRKKLAEACTLQKR